MAPWGPHAPRPRHLQVLDNGRLYGGLPGAPPGGDLQLALQSEQLRALERLFERLGGVM